jgi:RimJ/RimL family protein N-acetyltransferase
MFGLSSSDARVVRPASSLEEGGYEISGFRPADALDIPRAFEEVYGKDYLNPQVYDAAGFAGVVASGAQVSFIARDAEGVFAGHLALVFSAPNRRLVEVAQGIVLPAHRKSGIFGRLMTRAVAFAGEELGCQAVYGTALTNHAVSQKVLAHSGFRDVGLEVDYVPERMLRREGAGGPAATLVQYLDFGRDEEAPCHLPASYAGWFSGLLDGAAIAGERHVVSSTRLELRASESEANDMPRFDMSRLLVRRAGFDFWRLVGSFEAAAEAAGRRSVQILVGLGEQEGAAAVELLRGWGYACGGLVPGYLEGGRHVAIMYRSFAAPYFSGVRLHTAAAERLLACVVADWKRAQGLWTCPVFVDT